MTRAEDALGGIWEATLQPPHSELPHGTTRALQVRYCSHLGCRICSHSAGQWIPIPACLHVCRLSSSSCPDLPSDGMDTSHSWPAQEVQEPLPTACCRAEVERSSFLPQTALEAQALLAESPVLAGAGTAGGDLAKAAIPGRGSAGGRDWIKERRRPRLLAPLAVTPPGWREARPRHPARQ